MTHTRKGSRVTIISKRERVIELSVVQNVSKMWYTETKIVPFYWEGSYWDYWLRLPRTVVLFGMSLS